MKEIIEKCCIFFKKFSPWVLGTIAVVSANLASDAVIGTLKVWGDGSLGELNIIGFGEVVFLLFMVFILYKIRDMFVPPRTRFFSSKNELVLCPRDNNSAL